MSDLPMPNDSASLVLGEAMNGAMGYGVTDMSGIMVPSHYRAHVRVRLRERGYDIRPIVSIEDQPPPRPSGSRPTWELVIEDMRQRDETGRKRYGTPLQANNGRDALVDAYQEALDLCVYLRQAIEER